MLKDFKTIKTIRIVKNRGWRGLAELICEDEKRKTIHKTIFSFSEQVWRDLLKGYIVIQDSDNYYVLEFDNLDKLPKPTQQRSVLIKSFIGTVMNITAYSKNTPLEGLVPSDDYDRICNFKNNKNNHTTSDWNCIRNKSIA